MNIWYKIALVAVIASNFMHVWRLDIQSERLEKIEDVVCHTIHPKASRGMYNYGFGRYDALLKLCSE